MAHGLLATKSKFVCAVWFWPLAGYFYGNKGENGVRED